MKRPGGLIVEVTPGSLGDRIGLQPGDRLISINDHPLRDVIDVHFYGAEELLRLRVERNRQELRIQAVRKYGEELGLSFAHPTFDVEIRTCANHCDFCFVTQNAPGMRRSLYVKDDDYRYSFLLGHFVTLTNLNDDDWARLEEQRLSPLYVSVHATEPELRRRILGRQDAPDILEQFHRLAELQIEVHAQVVLIPGLNDGPHLERTLADLTALYRRPVASVGIVPIGLTRYSSSRCRPYTSDESRAVLDQFEPWRVRQRRKRGVAFFYPSDEWYLVAGRPVPPTEEYDGFPQLENGVGMVRQLLDEWEQLKADLPSLHVKHATVVCGTLIAPIMARLVQELNSYAQAELHLVPVVNHFFGPTVTVSGLLTGQDVVAALRDRFPGAGSGGQRATGELVLLPRSMFTQPTGYGTYSTPPGLTLDDRPTEELSTQMGVPVEMAATLREMIMLLS